MELHSSRLTLREFQPDDFISFRALEICPETYRYELSSPDEAATHTYLEHAMADTLQSPRTRYRFFVTLPADNLVISRVALTLINTSIQEWEIGWAIHPELWGQGFATEAAHCLLDFAFHDLHIHRVVAFSHSENLASIRVMEKLKMRREGVLRETRRWRDGWADEVVYALLERDWH
jgi:[ribosomal protein S5]-alanine N-acetyltransferase